MTNEIVPSVSAVLSDGSIVVSDIAKERVYIYTSEGILKLTVPWKLKAEYLKYQYQNIMAYTAAGNIWYKINNYILKDSNGTIITKSIEKPDIIPDVKQPDNNSIQLRFPDKEYLLKGTVSEKYLRDVNKNLYGISRKKVIRYDGDGNILATLVVPENSYVISPVPSNYPENMEYPRDKALQEYGDALVGPNGDIYAWKRDDAKYYVLKWVWQ